MPFFALGSAQAHAAGVFIGAVRQVQQARLPLCNGPRSAAWSLLQPDARRQRRTQSRLVSSVQASQIEAGHELREQVDQYWKIREQWADEQVEGRFIDTAEAKKGGSKRASKPRSAKRSKP